MIDEHNNDGTQWARFSDDRTLRYRLARDLRPTWSPFEPWLDPGDTQNIPTATRIVFVMLNPSKADAFRLDPTVSKCVKFATAWGFNVIEIVNIFPYRSTDPDALYSWTRGLAGADWENINAANTAEIGDACRRAGRVIAAWGKHGAHFAQGTIVRLGLHEAGIKLHCLDTNKDGSPKHPLYIKGGTEPKEWNL